MASNGDAVNRLRWRSRIGSAPARVSCETARKDRYGRWLARCKAGGEDIALWLAAQGWGVAYKDCRCETIRGASEYAELNRLGIWSGSFDMPWDWRRQNN